MKKTIVIIILTLSFFAFGTEKSLAFDWGIDMSGFNQAIHDAQDKMVCQAAQPKVRTKFLKINGVCRDQYDHFNNILSRLSTIAAGARANGYDTDRLESDRRIFLNKFNVWNSDCTMMHSFLNPLSTYSCNNGTAQDLAHMKSRIATAKGYIDDAKDKSKEMKSFYREVIRGDINILKNQQYQEEN
ncbi:MAG: hypothetical protein WCV59_04800 [Parcubacteria group bacterium]|jgi:hypothetical protein